MRGFLADRGASLAPRYSILHYEDLPSRRVLPRGTYIFSALDQLRPAGLELVADLHDQLLAAAPETRVLNHPRKTLLRLDLLVALHRAGLNRHRAVPAEGELSGLSFPVFVREEHGHTGTLSELLHSPKELADALAVNMARGHRLRDMLVVEFYETADSRGYYRKYAALVVGDRILPRGLAYGREWMLKAQGTEFSEAMLEEEREFVNGNPHEEQLRQIARLGGVGYGRIDYSVRDGRVETWEINLNPTIGAGAGNRSALRITPELRALREPTRKAWTEKFIAALAAVDAGGDGEPAIPVSPRVAPPASRRMVVGAYSQARAGLARSVLRPVLPAAKWLVRLVSPLLLRLTRRAR